MLIEIPTLGPRAGGRKKGSVGVRKMRERRGGERERERERVTEPGKFATRTKPSRPALGFGPRAGGRKKGLVGVRKMREREREREDFSKIFA